MYLRHGNEEGRIEQGGSHSKKRAGNPRPFLFVVVRGRGFECLGCRPNPASGASVRRTCEGDIPWTGQSALSLLRNSGIRLFFPLFYDIVSPAYCCRNSRKSDGTGEKDDRMMYFISGGPCHQCPSHVRMDRAFRPYSGSSPQLDQMGGFIIERTC